jgi:hypothetical protein
MRKLILTGVALLLAVSAQAQVSAGINITDEGVKNFYLAIGQNYNVPEREVVVVHERRIPDDEIPVVFFLARRAHVKPEVIIQLRLGGRSWMDITEHYHLRPSIFFMPMSGDPGPAYGRAYGYWKHPRKEWSRLRFEDDDIVKMVNLQFVSNHYRVRPEEVARVRGEQDNFVKVTRVISSPDYRNSRGNGHGNGSDNNSGNSKSNGKGHGQGHGNVKGDKHDSH